jgi:integrase
LARVKVTIADMWKRKPWNVNRRGSTERPLSAGSIKDNRILWTKFAKWADTQELRFAENITSKEAIAFRDSLLAAKLSGDRINKAIMACLVMFDLSEIVPNPFVGIRKQAHRPASRRELTADELTAVCQAAKGELRPLFAIGLYTGMRLGDACSLEWAEIDAGCTRIQRVTSKTGKEIVVPIHPVLAAILQEMPRDDSGPVMPELAGSYNESTSRVSRWIQAHFTRCEIKTHKPKTGGKSGKRAVVEVGFHSLRHSFITISAREGAPLHVIQALVGHASPAMQRIYLHASQADAERAIAALPSITGEADPEAADRAKLASLAQSLPIGQVREWLAVVEVAS